MAGPWLYPISAAASRFFTLEESRQSVPVTVDSYRALVEDGRIVEDQRWYISQHWDHIEVGDELFIYTGDRDLGIIGYATVADVEQCSDGWCIHPRFDVVCAGRVTPRMAAMTETSSVVHKDPDIYHNGHCLP